MQKVLITILGLFFLNGTCFGGARGTYSPYIAVEADYTYLRRASSYNMNLVTAAGGPLHFPAYVQPKDCAKEKGKALISSRELIDRMHFTSGITGSLKIFPQQDFIWEVQYIGGLNWKGEKTKWCIENLNLNGPLAFQTHDYNYANKVHSLYSSDMYTIELNCWHAITPRYTDYFSVSWVLGARYFDVHEKIKLEFTKMFPTIQTSHYRLKVANQILGVQMGGKFECNPYAFLTWGFVAKLGGFSNQTHLRRVMLDKNNTQIIQNNNRHSSHFAYMGEFYPFLELRPSKHFFFHIHYQVLYLGSIATADRNLRFEGSGNTLNQRSHILYHGLTSGVQFNF